MSHMCAPPFPNTPTRTARVSCSACVPSPTPATATVCQITEFFKTAAAAGRGVPGLAMINWAAAHCKDKGATRMDLKVRTHIDGQHFKPTERAVAIYDEAGLDEESEDSEHLYMPEDGQEYRSGRIMDIIMNTADSSLPTDVRAFCTDKCRMRAGMWYEDEVMGEMPRVHAPPPLGDGAAQSGGVAKLLPRRGRKTCLYFCVPRQKPMDTEE